MAEVVISSQNPRSLSTRRSGALPAMIAALMAPIETPTIEVGMKPVLGQRLINARLIGAERAAPLQQQRDAIEREPCAQVPAFARRARFGDERSFRERRLWSHPIAQRYRRHTVRDHALGHG